MEPDQVTLLTLTGSRPQCFELCEYYMGRQTFMDWTWLVVDDGQEPTPTTLGQRVLRPEPFWDGTRNTLRRNFEVGLSWLIEHGFNGCVIMVEDDDWYSKDYVMTMVDALNRSEHELVGEGWTLYYHVFWRTYRKNTNSKHASLCATAFSSEILQDILWVVQHNDTPFLDHRIFGYKKLKHRNLIMDSNHCVGIKGMPGRGGTGRAHENMDRVMSVRDPELKALKKFVGEDWELYVPFTEEGEL